MFRKAKFTPEENEQAVIDYLEGNKSRTQICGELHISSRTIQDWPFPLSLSLIHI